jgi:hypothetical protein
VTVEDLRVSDEFGIDDAGDRYAWLVVFGEPVDLGSGCCWCRFGQSLARRPVPSSRHTCGWVARPAT